jgi:hypothetical protein
VREALREVEEKRTFTATTDFLRQYGIMLLGDAGWRQKSMKGFAPSPKEKDFFRMLDIERGISCYLLNEDRTTKVSYLLGCYLLNIYT